MGVLRFTLAITVVIAHSSSIIGFDFVGGQMAVQAFYIISGFYMTLILNEKYIGINNSYRLFITNRFLRLYPVYWSVLLLTFIYSLIDPSNNYGNEYAAFSYYLKYFHDMSFTSFSFLVFTNVFILFQDSVMFLGLNTSTGNLFFTQNFRQTSPLLYQFLFVPQAWSIGIEMAFYLIAPLLVRRKLKIIITLIVLSFTLRIILSKYGLNLDPWSYRFFPTELAYFLIGSVSYHIYTNVRRLKIRVLYLKVCWISLLAFTFLYSFIHVPGKRYAYLFAFFICLPFIFILTKNWERDKYIGELSYPIYISHIFILSCIVALKIPIIGGLGLTLTLMTTIISVILNELVTKKIEKVRQKRIMPVL
ncbi:acyltransferase family protein [Spirosoma luteum]|uniref:acyltransferase family protein n=1 Tax=Spirosoma luteum TaxID=431553 RepID=UPI000374E447